TTRRSIMELSATLIELKPGVATQVEDWKSYINKHLPLAVESISAEGVEVESWFHITLEGKDYLLCYMRANSMEFASEVVKESTNPVDVYHREFLRSAGVRRAATGRLLVDLVARD